MKCPFRTIKTTESVVDKDTFSPTCGKAVKEIETIDFSECIGEECPYYYCVNKIDTSSGSVVEVPIPACRMVKVHNG